MRIIYKLNNYLFGWDYVVWTDYLADKGISRVVKLPDGTIGYWDTILLPIFSTIKNPESVVWLTCKPEKYFKLNNK